MNQPVYKTRFCGSQSIDHQHFSHIHDSHFRPTAMLSRIAGSEWSVTFLARDPRQPIVVARLFHWPIPEHNLEAAGQPGVTEGHGTVLALHQPPVFPALHLSREHQHAVKGHRLRIWQDEPCLGGAGGDDGLQFPSALKANGTFHAVTPSGNAAEIHGLISG